MSLSKREVKIAGFVSMQSWRLILFYSHDWYFHRLKFAVQMKDVDLQLLPAEIGESLLLSDEVLSLETSRRPRAFIRLLTMLSGTEI